MKMDRIDPPRTYETGFDVKRTIADCGRILLEPDEQVTFTTRDGGEYDVTRKDFGFYATPSLNGRLKRFKLRSVLVRNRIDQYFLLLVEEGKEDLFERYMREECMNIVTWMDTAETLSLVARAVEEYGKPSH